MKKNRVGCFFGILTLSLINYGILSSNSELQIQELHKKISDDLLSIRKEYPKSQPMVYPLLDEVSKFYQISKNNLEKKRNLKKINKANEIEIVNLKKYSSAIKNEFDKLKKELEINQQNFNVTNKKMEQKDSVLTFLAKEKLKLTQERDKLAAEKEQLFDQLQKIQNQTLQNQIIQQNNNSSQQEKSIETSQNEKINKNTTFFGMKNKKNNLLQYQNLSLTSTSDPISPL